MVTSWSFLHLLLPCLHSRSCGLFEVAVFVGTQVGISFDGLFSVACLVEQNSSCLISLFAFIFSNFSLAQPWPHWLVNMPSGLSLVPLNSMLSCRLCSSAVAGTAGPPLVRVGAPPSAPPRGRLQPSFCRSTACQAQPFSLRAAIVLTALLLGSGHAWDKVGTQ